MDEELKNGENEINTARRDGERRRLEQREQGKNIEKQRKNKGTLDPRRK
jgi:hypothetical protein